MSPLDTKLTLAPAAFFWLPPKPTISRDGTPVATFLRTMSVVRRALYSVGILVSWTLSITAHAFIFSSDDLEFPDQSCKLIQKRTFKEVRNGKEYAVTETVLCTSTLVAQRYLLSSAHCGYATIWSEKEVRCPGQPIRQVRKIHRHDEFAMENGEVPDHLRAYDVAVVELEEPVSTKPLRIPKDNIELKAWLDRKPIVCESHGFGVDGTGMTGRGNSATIPIDYEYRSESLLLSSKKVMGLSDSGAGLLCGQNRDTVIAVYHGNAKRDPKNPYAEGSGLFVTLQSTLGWIHNIVDHRSRHRTRPETHPAFLSTAPSDSN